MRWMIPVVLLLAFVSGCAIPLEVTSESVVEVMSEDELKEGSGFIIARDGNRYWAVTVAHITKGGKCKVNGELTDGGMIFPALDIAMVTFKSDKRYKPLRLADARRGQPVRLFGYPGTMKVLVQTRGHIMAVTEDLFDSAVYYDGGCSGGFSGGPLVDDYGRVLGIARSHMAVRHTNNDGTKCIMCYDTMLNAVPSSLIRKVYYAMGGRL